jgi:hypothetical protein
MSGGLLRDYLRRTSGAWLLAGFLQIIQSVTFWAEGVRRAPLLGAVLAGTGVARCGLAELRGINVAQALGELSR